MIALIVFLIVAGIVCWAVSALPIPPMFQKLIWAVIAIALVLYIASAFFGVHVGTFPRG